MRSDPRSQEVVYDQQVPHQLLVRSATAQAAVHDGGREAVPDACYGAHRRQQQRVISPQPPLRREWRGRERRQRHLHLVHVHVRSTTLRSCVCIGAQHQA